MGNRTTRAVMAIALIGLLQWTASAARAAQAAVKDDAAFFSPGVVSKAGTDLDQLNSQYHHKVMIETYAELPPELRGQVDGNDASINQAYENFSEMRARSLGADVYVLINKTPPHVQVIRRNDIARSGLTDAGRESLRRDLLTRFRAKQYDDALTNLTASLKATYDAGVPTRSTGGATPGGTPGSTPPPLPPRQTGPADPAPRQAPSNFPAPASSSGGGFLGSIGCIGIVVILVVVFLVIRLIRGLLGGNRGGYPPAGYQGGPGGYGQPGYGGGYPQQQSGGFGRGLFGGLLGGLFGSYLGGNVFGQGHNTSNDNTGGVFGGGSGDTPAGGGGADPQGFSGSGGDFGPSDPGPSSGGDSGFSGSGGDFSGGGDSGGGGGDSGSF